MAQQVQRPREQRVELVGAEPHLERRADGLVAGDAVLLRLADQPREQVAAVAIGPRAALGDHRRDQRVERGASLTRATALGEGPVPACRPERQHEPSQRRDAELESLEQVGPLVEVGPRQRLPVDRPAQRAQLGVQLDRVALAPRIGPACRARDGELGDAGILEQRLPELVALAVMLGPVGEEEPLRVPLLQAHQPAARDRRPVLVVHRELEQLGLLDQVDGLVAELEGHDVTGVVAQLVQVAQRVRQEPDELGGALVTRARRAARGRRFAAWGPLPCS